MLIKSIIQGKNILDFQSYKEKLENLKKEFNIQSTKILESEWVYKNFGKI